MTYQLDFLDNQKSLLLGNLLLVLCGKHPTGHKKLSLNVPVDIERHRGAVISGAIGEPFDVIPGMALGGMKPPLVEMGIGRTANDALKQVFACQLAGYQVVASLNGVTTGVASTFTAAGENYIRGKLEAE